MRPLRFCMVTTFYPPHAFGGDGIFVYRLSRLLAGRGHQVDVVYSLDAYRALGREPGLAGFPPVPGVTVHALSTHVPPLALVAAHQWGRPLIGARGLREILARPWDVVHFHNVSLMGGPAVLGWGRGVRLWTLHDHWLVCPTHVLFRDRREPCLAPRCLRCTLIHRRPPQLWRWAGLGRRALSALHAVIVPSRAALGRHRAAGLDLPFVHLPPFVPEPVAGVAPAATVPRPRRPFLLAAGRLEPVKGFHTLIEPFRRHPRVDLVIAGDGSQAARLRALAAGSPRVHLVGWQPPEALATLYARALAVAVPTLGVEAFGLVAAEAMAHGTPVIVRDVGALGEIVADSGGGLTFTDQAGLLGAVERLLAEPGLRERLGEAGRRAYQARWTEAAHLGRYLGLVAALGEGRVPAGVGS